MVSSSVVPELETGCCEEERLLYLVPVLDDDGKNSGSVDGEYCFVGFTPSEKELVEFAAEMESLLWRGVGNSETFSLAKLGMVDDEKRCCDETGEVKGENDNDDKLMGKLIYVTRQVDMNFGYEHELETMGDKQNVVRRKRLGLRLDCEAVIEEWCASNNGEESSPWMDGEWPQFGPDDFSIDCTEMDMFGRNGRSIDDGWKVRVSRYRENEAVFKENKV